MNKKSVLRFAALSVASLITVTSQAWWTPWNDGPWSNGNGWNNGPYNNMPWSNGPWNNRGWNNNSWRNGPWNNRGWNNNAWSNGPWNNRGWNNNSWSNGPWNGNSFVNNSAFLDALLNGDVDFKVNVKMKGVDRFFGNVNGRQFGNGYGNGNAYGYANPYNGYYPAPYAYRAPAPVVRAPVKPVPFVNPDADADGVLDVSDLCLDTAKGTKVDFTGCAENAAITLRGVNFKLNSDELTAESSAILDRVVKTLTQHKDILLEVGGHTDNQGEATYNLDLSERRAKSVATYLIEHGVKAANLTAKGYGQTLPVASNETKEGRAMNRRVELSRIEAIKPEAAPVAPETASAPVTVEKPSEAAVVPVESESAVTKGETANSESQ